MSPLLQITSHWFVAGVVVGELAAPIVGYMRWWGEHHIRGYAKRRGWTVVTVN